MLQGPGLCLTAFTTGFVGVVLALSTGSVGIQPGVDAPSRKDEAVSRDESGVSQVRGSGSQEGVFNGMKRVLLGSCG